MFENNVKKAGRKNVINIFFFLTNIKMWHMFLHQFFKGFSKMAVALITKELWAI